MKTILSTIVATGRLAAGRWLMNNHQWTSSRLLGRGDTPLSRNQWRRATDPRPGSNRSFHSSWRLVLLAALALLGGNGVSQAACTYSIIPTNRTHGYAMATNTITLYATNGVCPWTVINTNSWITILSATNGVTSTAVRYTVAANPLPRQRTGVVMVAQLRCTIVQREFVCQYSLSPSNRVHGNGATTNTFSVRTGDGCAWTVVNTNTWITIPSPAQGTGPDILTYVVAANPALLVERTGVITITGLTTPGSDSFSVTQRGAPCTYSVSPNYRTNGYGATTGSVSVVSPSPCSWSVVNTNSWITIMSPLNATGDGDVRYAIGDNPGTNQRSGVVQIADEVFNLTQEGTPCTASISPHMRTHGYGATTNTVSVESALECPWTVANTNFWITILSANSGSGTGTVTYGVAANPTTNARTGVLVIGGEFLSMTQNAASCRIDLSPTNRTHGYGRATGTVSVTTISGCGWSVVNTNRWITILSGSSGSGEGNVNYWVEANPNQVDRTGFVVIGDERIKFTQLALVCDYHVSPTSRVHGWGQTTNTLDVYTSDGCQWTVLNTNSWITMLSSTSGSGDATLTYTVSFNQSTNDRSGVIRIADVPLTLTQYGRDRMFFQSVTRLSEGSLLFRLLGPTNAICELQGSPDLIRWTPIDALTNTTGAFQFIDTISASPGRRFYRAVRR